MSETPRPMHYQEVFSSRFGTTKAVVCSCGFATTYTLLSNNSDEAGMAHFRRQHAAVHSYPQREAMQSALEAWRRTHTRCCRDGCRQCAEDGNTPHRCALCIKTDAALEVK
jgi:hypothetical protein